MSYRPANYTQLQIKKSGVVSVVNSSYNSSGTIIKRETRYFDPNMILYLSVPSTNNGGIYLVSEDIMPNATVVSQNPNFTNVSNLFDHNDSTYAYDNNTYIALGTEQTEIVLNLGKAYTGFIYLNYTTNSNLYQRVYTSPDNSTWTQQINAGGSNAITGGSAAAYASNIQYIKLTYYNGSSYNYYASTSYWVTNSLEFYPLPAPRTYLQGDGTNKFYVVGIYNTGYELLEVWNI